MIKIAQFGEGTFLRAFAESYFQALNDEGGEYSITMFKPRPGTIEKFKQQNNRYHVILRGIENGQPTEKVQKITSVDDVISPFETPDKFYSLAEDNDLKIITSNTTESGICFCANDCFDDFESITFPAKLTKFLLARFNAGLDGVYIIPTELIDNNADKLLQCVNKYIALWNLPSEFKAWNDKHNFYCNALVDRIVSGYPSDDETQHHVRELIGEDDALLTIGEQYGLWVIEKKGEIEKYIVEGEHNVTVVLTDDISYYKRRKIRVLNGSHTNMAALGLVLSKSTVHDCMENERIHSFFKRSLDEIVPFVNGPSERTERFATAVERRFMNPFLEHHLTSITMNSITKWKTRILPTFKDYYAKNNSIPPCLTVGFSYLMYLYMTQYDKMQDDSDYLSRFELKMSLFDIMKDSKMWDEDLTTYIGFYETVQYNIQKISKGELVI